VAAAAATAAAAAAAAVAVVVSVVVVVVSVVVVSVVVVVVSVVVGIVNVSAEVAYDWDSGDVYAVAYCDNVISSVVIVSPGLGGGVTTSPACTEADNEKCEEEDLDVHSL
jgi:hypothetical protein